MNLNYAVTFYVQSKSTLIKTQTLADGSVLEHREVLNVSQANKPMEVVAKPDEVAYIMNCVVRMKDGTVYGVEYADDDLKRCFAFVRDYGVDIQIG